MPITEYHFLDRWRVQGDLNEVADLIEDVLSLPRWWPSVYFDVKEIRGGDEHGVGRLVSLRAGGWLPYTLRINFRTVSSRYPNGFSLEATGDLEGTGIWSFEQDGAFVLISYDWTIRANKPLIRYLSFLLKPIFQSNHNWTMNRGEESLKLELARRHARTAEEALRIPSPPPPALLQRLRHTLH